MAFDSFFTSHYRLAYFGDGHIYSAEADRRRFVTLDRNLESYLGIVGVGVISGWAPVQASDLSVYLTLGSGFINGFYSESGWTVKKTEDVLPTDVVMTRDYYTDPLTGQVYDRVWYRQALFVPDDSDVYLYAFRNSNYVLTTPYYEPDNVDFVPETFADQDPAKTAVAFAYASSEAAASSSNRVFLGVVSARDGAIVEIDTSGVDSLENMEKAIRQYGSAVIDAHKHGGAGPFDPPAIRLQTDVREMFVSGNSDAKVEYVAQNSEHTSKAEEHEHTYWIDSDGDGITISVFGEGGYHFHDISEFSVGDVKGAEGTVASHTHALNLPEVRDDGWDASSTYQIYINDEPYDGSLATVDADAKTVTFSGDVTVKFRTYGITHGDFEFQSVEKSLYRFMLRAALAYGSANPEETNIILPDPATPIEPLKNQALVGEARLSEEGNVFTFVDPAASDVAVTLLQEAHIDEVKIEILTNAEVKGKLPQDNILYIPASKIASGTFEPERIPLLDHLGRFLELSEPRSQRAKSADGRLFEIERSDVLGNAKIVYSAIDDGHGTYLLGTSDGVYRKPAGGSYYWVVNGVPVVTDTGDIGTRIVQAAAIYQAKSGISVVIDGTYDAQIERAENQVAGIGDNYGFTGNKNEDADGGFDKIWLFWVEQYRLTDYGYQTTRFEGEIRPDEEIVFEIEQEEEEAAEGEEEAADLPRLFLVRNDFHKTTVKRLLAEQSAPSGYDGNVIDRYYAASGQRLTTSVSVDREWKLLDDAAVTGYVYDLEKNYSGVVAVGTSGGFKVSTRSGGQGFRHVPSPYFDAEARSVSFGFGDRFLVALRTAVCVTDDYGDSWFVSDLAASDMLHVLFDPTLDVTDSVLGHSHAVYVGQSGFGETSEAAGHVHAVSEGVVGVAMGHSHEIARTFYAVSRSGAVYRSLDSGDTWSRWAAVPIEHSEFGAVAAAFGKFYVAVEGKLVYTENGSAWSDFAELEENVYGMCWNAGQDALLIGGANALWSFDGTVLTVVFEDAGAPVPAVFEADVEKKFSWILNNLANSFDMRGRIMLGTKVDVIDSFDFYYPEQDGWSDGVEYDLYLNDRILKSTRKGIDRTGDVHVAVDNVSVIDFSVSSILAANIAVGDSEIAVYSADSFPDSGIVAISIPKTENQDLDPTYFFSYESVSLGNNKLNLTEPSKVSVEAAAIIGAEAAEGEEASEPTGTAVRLLSALGADDIVRITVYEGKLTNVGTNTHADLEDALHMEDIGLGKRMSDVYLSNLVHLTIATKYALPAVDSEYSNSFISMFDYNDTPGDPDNIDRFIDRRSSDLASLALYQTAADRRRSSSLNRFVKCFGDFEGCCLAASNVGLFVSDCSASLEANWFRVDVDGSVGCYDVLQHRSDIVYVSTEKGMYVNADDTLLSWTQLDPQVIGGIPSKIAPRWTTLVDEETGIDYWWGKWDGVVNENEALVNTIIASGEGFLSFSDDRGLTWLDGFLYGPGGSQLQDMIPLGYTLLKNGSMAVAAKKADGSLAGVYVATGTGAEWNSVHSSGSVAGTIESMSVTDDLNVRLSVDYRADPPPQRALAGRFLVIGDASYRVVTNAEGTITVFGESIVDEIRTSFSVRPAVINSVFEDSEKRLMLGTSRGVLSDQGGFFSAARRRDGRIVSLGNRATIESVNISGTVGSSFAAAGVLVMTAELDRKVGADELKGQIVRFYPASIAEQEIKSNGSSRPDGTVSITVTDPEEAVPAGYTFQVVGEGTRLYVEYDGVVKKGDLAGGSLLLEPQGLDIGLARDELPVFAITANTEEYIDLSPEVQAPEGLDPLAELIPGTVVFATNSDGSVPVTVQFDTQRLQNELRGNSILVRGQDDALPVGGEIGVLGNDEIGLVLEETYLAEGVSQEGGSQEATYSVYNTLLQGVDFYLQGIPFMPLPTFNDKSASVSEGHRHDVEMVTGPITADIASLGAVTATTVELELENAVNLSDSFVQANPDLFEGHELVAYDPAAPELSYRLTVSSHGASSITAVRSPNTFDFDGESPKKVGAGYRVVMSTLGYGRTVGTDFTSDYVVGRLLLSADAFIGGTELAVENSAGVVVGTRAIVSDDTGIRFETEIASVPGPVAIEIANPLPFDLLVERAAKIDLTYGIVAISSQDLSADGLQGSSSIQVADASAVAPGDFVDLYDDRGLFEQYAVNTATGTTVTLTEPLSNDYLTANEAYAIFRRPNTEDGHRHSIRASEFSIYRDETRTTLGGSLSHGHYLAPLIAEVVDIRSVEGTVYAVGSGPVVYSTEDNGETWEVDFDLSQALEFVPSPKTVTGIFFAGEDIVFGTSAGYFAYKSPRFSTAVRPLDAPGG